MSDWTVIRDEPGGRDKNKRWIAEDADAPRDQHWLWKYRQTTGDGSEAALTDCAEVFTRRPASGQLGDPGASERRRALPRTDLRPWQRVGAGLTDDNRRDKDPVAFARRGRANPFSPRKQLLVDLALEAVRRSGADLWVARGAALDGVSIRETLEAPQGRMSEVASTFMEQVVLENQRRLCRGDAAED